MPDLTEQLIELIRRTSNDPTEHVLSFADAKLLQPQLAVEMEMA